MAVFGVDQFAGMVPTTGHRQIPKNFAVESVNTWLYAKELRGIRPSTRLTDVTMVYKKVFRIPKGTADPSYPYEPGAIPPASYLGNSVWKVFDDPDTDVVKGVLINDAHDRWYFASPSRGPEMNTLAGMQAGNSNFILGVITPTAPISSITYTGGVASTNVSRAYVYTTQTIYGEESAPSPAIQGDGKPDATWNINGIPTPADEPNRAPYKYVNLYRTITGASGVATYFRITQFNIEGTNVVPATYPDAMSDTTLSNSVQLETVGWLPPPAKLQGLLAMPNGFLMGWVDSDVYMSVPYYPHAWPIEYILSTEYPIVGMGVFGNTCVIATQGYPSAITGTDPSTTAFTKLNTVEPCLSRGSIVSGLSGVYYASQNGLIVINSSGVQNATSQLITREQWIKSYSPEYIRACRYQNGYLAVRCIPDKPNRSAFFLDPTQVEVALTELEDFENVENVIADVWSGEVFKLQNFPDETPSPLARVWRWDTPSDDFLPVRWRSKEFQFQVPINFGCYAIHWDQDRFLANDWDLGTDIIPAGVPVWFRAWAGRRLVYDQAVPVARNGKAVRLPSGFNSDIWQFEICSRAPVYSVGIAQTPRELISA